MQDEATKKNFSVLQDAFNHMNRRLDEQHHKIGNLEAEVVMLKTKMQEAIQHLQVLRAITGGTGPTVRS